MRIDIITLFPEMCESFLNESVIGRARKKGAVEFECHQLRDYAFDKHKRVDDSTYGGGMGMLMKAEPIALCFEDICRKLEKRPHFIYMSPKGKVLTQERVKELSELENIVILCGHYEGVDQRVIDEYVDEEISIGDYVLTGGEIPAMAIVDSITRLLPGVINEESHREDSFKQDVMNNRYLLDYPTYTQPRVFRGMEVPEVLLSGNHQEINKYREEKRQELTNKKRPDLLNK